MKDENIKNIENLRNNSEIAERFFAKKLAFTISPQGLYNLYKEKNVIIIDVRLKSDYEIAHIPNSISIPFGELEDKMLDLNKEILHVVYGYDKLCQLGTKAAYLLSKNIYTVLELNGGFQTWSEDYHFATT